MRDAPPYSSDHLPGDLMAGLRLGLAVAPVSGVLTWLAGRAYLLHTYPAHPELLPSAIVAGCADGVLLGLGTGVFAVAYRIWKRERKERKRSDDLLRLALDDLERDRRGGYEG